MHRNALLDLLAHHRAFDAVEAQYQQIIEEFIESCEDCFLRSNSSGHITGGAWILHPDHQRVLLVNHRRLKRWLQSGGHADGNPDLLAVALREANEETGLITLELLHLGIFDVDVHFIPDQAGTPAHLHYDIRFIFEARDPDNLLPSDESTQLAWVPLANLPAMDVDESIHRMARKTQCFFEHGTLTLPQPSTPPPPKSPLIPESKPPALRRSKPPPRPARTGPLASPCRRSKKATI